MQPVSQSSRQKYLQIIVILLFVLLMIIGTRSPSLWRYLALLPILIILLAIQFNNRGICGIGQVLLVAGVCVGGVAAILFALLFSALWSWWIFGVLATVVVFGAFWLDRYLRTKYRTFFVSQPEEIDRTARARKN
jgi:hypothetical protein